VPHPSRTLRIGVPASFAGGAGWVGSRSLNQPLRRCFCCCRCFFVVIPKGICTNAAVFGLYCSNSRLERVLQPSLPSKGRASAVLFHGGWFLIVFFYSQERSSSAASGNLQLTWYAAAKGTEESQDVRVGALSRMRAVSTAPLRLSCSVIGNARTLQVSCCSSGRG